MDDESPSQAVQPVDVDLPVGRLPLGPPAGGWPCRGVSRCLAHGHGQKVGRQGLDLGDGGAGA